VLSPTRITLENKKNFLKQPDRENAFAGASGGQRGIRTLETVPRLHTFQACAFDHSAICPCGATYRVGHANGKGVPVVPGQGSARCSVTRRFWRPLFSILPSVTRPISPVRATWVPP